MAQQKQAGIDQDWMNGAVRSSTQLATGHVERSLMTTPQEEEAHIPEVVRRKMDSTSGKPLYWQRLPQMSQKIR